MAYQGYDWLTHNIENAARYWSEQFNAEAAARYWSDRFSTEAAARWWVEHSAKWVGSPAPRPDLKGWIYVMSIPPWRGWSKSDTRCLTLQNGQKSCTQVAFLSPTSSNMNCALTTPGDLKPTYMRACTIAV